MLPVLVFWWVVLPALCSGDPDPEDLELVGKSRGAEAGRKRRDQHSVFTHSEPLHVDLSCLLVVENVGALGLPC